MEGLTYCLHINGVFKNNIKAKFDSIQICETLMQDHPSANFIGRSIERILSEIKAKPGCQWRMMVYPTHFGHTVGLGVVRNVEITKGREALKGVVK